MNQSLSFMSVPKSDKFISGINLRRARLSSQSMLKNHSAYEDEDNVTKMKYLKKGDGLKYLERRASMNITSDNWSRSLVRQIEDDETIQTLPSLKGTEL